MKLTPVAEHFFSISVLKVVQALLDNAIRAFFID